jgi:DnaK suppressor protein
MQTYDKNQATRFTQLLAHREEELRAALRTNEDWPERIGEPEAREVSDFKDMATRRAQATLDEAQAEHVAFDLEQVLAAQYRLDDGSYGRCQRCGEDIDVRRLAAMPATPYCTACQSIQEHERPPHVRG